MVKSKSNFRFIKTARLKNIILSLFLLCIIISCSKDDFNSYTPGETVEKDYGPGTPYAIDVDSLYTENEGFQNFIANLNPERLENIPDWNKVFV